MNARLPHRDGRVSGVLAGAVAYNCAMEGAETRLINVDPEILGGEPVFMGTRVPVASLVDWLTNGYSLEQFLDNFPSVSSEQATRFLVEAGLEYTERHGTPAA